MTPDSHKRNLKKRNHLNKKHGTQRHLKHRHHLSKRQIEAKRAKQKAEKERKELEKIPIYKLVNVLPMIYEIHQKMKHPTPLKVASTCFLLWAVYAGITSDRPNVQLFIPLFNPDPDLGVICKDVYMEERRHKFDYMPKKELPVDDFTKEIMDYVITQADELNDEDMMKITKRDQAYQYALQTGAEYLEPYIIINQYASWVDAIYANYKKNHHMTNSPDSHKLPSPHHSNKKS